MYSVLEESSPKLAFVCGFWNGATQNMHFIPSAAVTIECLSFCVHVHVFVCAQLNKNSKADVVIKDLYVENAQLMQALQLSEQRHKVAEKKNFLLEEKISSLNKIVRELGPSPLSPIPYPFSRPWPVQNDRS